MMREIRITDRFHAYTGDGRVFGIVEYTEIVTYTAKGMSVEVEEGKFFQTAEGDDVTMMPKEGLFTIDRLRLQVRRAFHEHNGGSI